MKLWAPWSFAISVCLAIYVNPVSTSDIEQSDLKQESDVAANGPPSSSHLHKKSGYYPDHRGGSNCPCPGSNCNNCNSCPTCGHPPSPPPPTYMNPCAAGQPALTYAGSPLICSSGPSQCPRSHWCHVGATTDTTCCCPGASQDPCQLPMQSGSGYAQLSRYYYNSQSGTCQQFIYRGLMGNQNCFPSISECQSTCRVNTNPCSRGQPLTDSSGRSQACNSNGNYDHCGNGYWCHFGATAETTVCCPGSDDPCNLPCGLGQGNSNLQRWFFNGIQKQCTMFVYNGLQGNANNFLTREDCEKKCKPLVNPCAQGQPIQDMSGRPTYCGNYRNSCPQRSWCHFGADAETTLCCPGAVGTRESCQLDISRGFGQSALSRWYYDTNSRRCTAFTYTGLGGNQNNFLSREDCQLQCTESENPCANGEPAGGAGNRALSCNFRSGCGSGYYCHIGGKQETTVCCQGSQESACTGSLPPNEGMGDFSLPRWYYDVNSRQCREFSYRGLKGNPNNFQSQQDCETTCQTAQNPCVQSAPPPSLSCSTVNPNSCPVGQWCHYGATSTTTICCAGAVSNPCNEPMSPGTGTDMLPRYYYNAANRLCMQFEYHGLMGNQNNFISQRECETRCNTGANPCPAGDPLTDRNNQAQTCTVNALSSTCPSGYWCHVGATSASTACCQNTGPNACTLPRSTGQGNASLPRFAYDPASRQCQQFTYTGSKGNENNFLTLQSCELACGEFTNPCIGQPATTPTGQVVFCTSTNKEMCPVNFWCHVGASAQTTLCCPGATNPCSVPFSPGRGTNSLPRWYYNADSRTCQQFTYLGMGGNQNNFERLNECEQACPSELCALSVDQGATCNNLQTRYAYDRQTRTCTSFTYNGCGGNLNNFPTMQECLTTCGGTGYRRKMNR